MNETNTVTILNVDDNEAGRYATTRVLQRAGFNVIEASTGAETLRAVAEERPDLVILDINLPDMSGFEVCDRIRESSDAADLPVLHLSATYVMSLDRLEQSKADGYLMQPIEPAALVANIRALLRIRDAQRHLRRAVLEWETALNAVDQGICILDPDDSIIRWNQTFARLVGLSVKAAAGYRGVAETTPGSPFDDVLQLMHSSRSRECATIELEGGSYRLTVDPMIEEGGELAGSVLVLTELGTC